MRGTTASQRRLTPATAAPPPPAIAPGEKAAPLADDAPLNFSAAALIATHSCLSCSTREARILLIYARSFSHTCREDADTAKQGREESSPASDCRCGVVGTVSSPKITPRHA